jgi:hypothetical protein
MTEQSGIFTEEQIQKFKSGEVDLKDIVDMFNPLNALSIPEPAFELFPHLTNEQIEALATAYPNQATGNAYLVLTDKTVKSGKQLFPRSTWQNLRNLRRLEAGKNYVAFGYAARINEQQKIKAALPVTGTALDESKADIMKQGGLTTATPQASAATGQIPQQQQAALTTAADKVGNVQTAAEKPEARDGAENANNSTGQTVQDGFEDLQVPGVPETVVNDNAAANVADASQSSLPPVDEKKN